MYQMRDSTSEEDNTIQEYIKSISKPTGVSFYDEISEKVPKHIKKQSSVSNSKKKSKHRHEYIDCLLIIDDRKPHKATYCKICGKVGDIKFFEVEKTNHGTFRMLNTEEVYEKYKNLPQIHVKDVFKKYVSIDVEE